MLNQIVGGVVVGLGIAVVSGTAYAAWGIGRLAHTMADTAAAAAAADKAAREEKEAKAKKEEKKDA